MRNFMAVFTFELKQQITRRAYLLLTFGIPVLVGVVLLGYSVYQDATADDAETDDPSVNEFEEADPIGYVDLTDTIPAPQAPYDELVIVYDDVASGESALEATDISILYIVGEDYYDTAEVTQVTDGFKFEALDSTLFEAYLLTQLAGDTPPEVLFRLRFPLLNLNTETLEIDGDTTTATQTEEDFNFLLVYIFALILMFSTFTTSGYLLQTVVKEKETKAIEIILTSIKPFPLLAGKVLAMGLTGMFQIAIWLIAGIVYMNVIATEIFDLVDFEVSPVLVVIALVYYLLGFTFVGGVFAGIGALTNDTREGSQISGFLVLPLIIPLMMIGIFVEDPNGTVPTILSIIPFTAPLSMVMRFAMDEAPLVEVLISVVLMSLFAVGSMWMAGRLFRVSSLLRGTTPKLKDIPKLLFTA